MRFNEFYVRLPLVQSGDLEYIKPFLALEFAQRSSREPSLLSISWVDSQGMKYSHDGSVHDLSDRERQMGTLENRGADLAATMEETSASVVQISSNLAGIERHISRRSDDLGTKLMVQEEAMILICLNHPSRCGTGGTRR